MLAWGYFKIIADALITPFLAYFLLLSLVMSLYGGNNERYAIWILLYAVLILVILVMFVTDFVASIMFVVAGHKKNLKLIRGFYIYSIAVLIMTALLIVLGVGISISNWRSDAMALHLVLFAGYLLILVVQAYFILLLRSEVIKLNSSSEFRFVNNPAEAQCMMASKEREAAVENV